MLPSAAATTVVATARDLNFMSASRGCGTTTTSCTRQCPGRRRRRAGGGFVSVRERPQPQLLLADRPQPRQAVRLDDQEEDDQRAEDHELGVGDRGGADLDA